MTTSTQAHRSLAVTTSLGPDALLLTGFTGQEAISQLFSFRLNLLAANDKTIACDKILGQRVTIDLALPGGKKRCFDGIASRIVQGSRDTEYTQYQLEMVPQFWLWTKKVQSRTFQHLTVPDILKQVLAGLDVTFDIRGDFHPRDFCVQYRESDFHFANRLMEEEGIYYFFKHGPDGHKMVVANTSYSHPDLPARSTITYEEVEGGQRADSRITAWEKTQELRAGKYTLWDHCFELPGKHLEATKLLSGNVQAGKASHPLSVVGNDKLEIYDYPGGYAQRFDGVDRGGADRPEDLPRIYDDARRTVDIRMQQEAVQALTIRGASTCPQMVPGHKFTLERHYHADGLYLLTRVEHTVHLGVNFRSGGDAVLNYSNTFRCLPFGVPYRPAQTTPRPTVRGTQTAVVVGPAGEEIFTDKYGRVKVQFPWDRHGKTNADSSCWVRVATPWAGPPG
jgi:type VI secretion system secreted protein VgrG